MKYLWGSSMLISPACASIWIWRSPWPPGVHCRIQRETSKHSKHKMPWCHEEEDVPGGFTDRYWCVSDVKHWQGMKWGKGTSQRQSGKSGRQESIWSQCGWNSKPKGRAVLDEGTDRQPFCKQFCRSGQRPRDVGFRWLGNRTWKMVLPEEVTRSALVPPAHGEWIEACGDWQRQYMLEMVAPA